MGDCRARELEIQLKIEETKNAWKKELANNSIAIAFFIMFGAAIIAVILKL